MSRNSVIGLEPLLDAPETEDNLFDIGARENQPGSRHSIGLLSEIRKRVSRDRVRYKDGKYDLDLTYITDQIIAMGFPASGFESAWRNHIDDVSQMLEQYHRDCYMIWNLSDKRYDYSKFNHCTQEFGFPDHHSPPLLMLCKIVLTMHQWIKASSDNVAIVHCVGGKGRTGTVIACYLTYTQMFPDPLAALEFFAQKRSKTENGVKQPSQRRYVQYFADVLASGTPPASKSLCLSRIIMNSVPICSTSKSGCRPFIQIFDMSCLPARILFSSVWSDPDTSYLQASDGGRIWDVNCLVNADVLIKCTHFAKKEIMVFRFSFHTAFIDDRMRLYPSDLDVSSHSGCVLPDDFFIDVIFKCRSDATSPKTLEDPTEADIYGNLFSQFNEIVQTKQTSSSTSSPFSLPSSSSLVP